MGRLNTKGTVAGIVIGALSMKPSSSMLRWTAASASSPKSDSDSPSLEVGVPGRNHGRAILSSMAWKALCGVWRAAIALITVRICWKATLWIFMDWDSRSPKGYQHTYVTSNSPEIHAPTIASRSFGCSRRSRRLIASRRALKRLSFAVSASFRIVDTYSKLTIFKAAWSSR